MLLNYGANFCFVVGIIIGSDVSLKHIIRNDQSKILTSI